MHRNLRPGRVLPAVLAVALAGGVLVGCGGSDNSGADSDTIKIGGLFDLTGVNATVGTNVNNATQMVFDKVNADGGIDGKKLELVVQDEASDPAKAVTAYSYLRNRQGIQLIFGATFTGAAVAVADVADKQKTLLYSSSATSPLLTDPTRDYVFAANQTAAVAAKSIVSLVTSMGASKIGLVEETDAYGAQGHDALQAAIDDAGGSLSIAKTVKIAPDATDATSQVAELKSAGVDVVVISVILNPAVALIKAANQQGLDLPIVSYGGGAGTAVDELLEGDAPLEYYAPTPLACPLTAECAAPIVKEYQDEFDDEPSVWALQGYAAAENFVAALKDADDLTPDGVKKALETMGPFTSPLIPVPLEFGPDKHLAIDETYLIGHQGGKLTFLGNDIDDNKL